MPTLQIVCDCSRFVWSCFFPANSCMRIERKKRRIDDIIDSYHAISLFFLYPWISFFCMHTLINTAVWSGEIGCFPAVLWSVIACMRIYYIHTEQLAIQYNGIFFRWFFYEFTFCSFVMHTPKHRSKGNWRKCREAIVNYLWLVTY